ncbi:MAG: CheR family methyltransferase [Aliishimia sp.]
MVSQQDSKDTGRDDVPLVAIGASAGGLEPLEKFFEAVPDISGVAYVVVQHLSPDYRSMMNELLARKSNLPILHIKDGMEVAADTVYLNRPNMYVELDGSIFRTFPYQSGQGLPHLPIDRFFTSLSSRDWNRTVAVVMSGSGSDGSQGAQVLHEAGAAVLVQSMHEATFTSMPRSVLVSGFVDRVLDAAEMPRVVEEIFRHGKKSPASIEIGFGDGIKSILKQLESRHRVDFGSYKPTSVNRRIVRRLHLRGHGSLEEYDEVLSESEDAVNELFEDMLIGVTEFYRDTEAITALRHKVLDKLAQEASSGPPLKIWIPACASGEEVYTIAIELSEALREAGSERRFRIIGTDVHAKSVETASRGVYSAEKIGNVPAHLRKRYFVETNGDYVVDPALRQRIIFSVHNLINDPPFMNLDLISCRNLMIYLKEDPQASVISMFLFGLQSDRFLFLGASETVGKFSSCFATQDARWRIFQKLPDAKNVSEKLFSRRSTGMLMDRGIRSDLAATDRKPFFSEVQEVRTREVMIRAFDALLKRYAPASILMTADGKVLTWFGAASALIDTMNNLADWTMQEIVHPDLHFAINVGIEKLRQGQFNEHVRIVKLSLPDGQPQDVKVEIEALNQGANTPLILVKVDLEVPQAEVTEAQVDPVLTGAATDDSAVLSARIYSLERDLRLTEETLQHVTERLEASGEELQASNEELQASNEELQASNEELQSSNEELHAVNEELVSVSTEHERKIDLLSELNSSSEMVMKLLNTGIIVLDQDLNIRRFSQLIEREFLLQDHDIKRSIKTVGPRLDFADLEDIAAKMLEDSTPQTRSGTHEGRPLHLEARRVMTGPKDDETPGTIFLFRWG